MSMKRTRKLAADLKSAGFTTRITSKQHLLVMLNGQIVTPGDQVIGVVWGGRHADLALVVSIYTEGPMNNVYLRVKRWNKAGKCFNVSTTLNM